MTTVAISKIICENPLLIETNNGLKSLINGQELKETPMVPKHNQMIDLHLRSGGGGCMSEYPSYMHNTQGNKAYIINDRIIIVLEISKTIEQGSTFSPQYGVYADFKFQSAEITIYDLLLHKIANEIYKGTHTLLIDGAKTYFLYNEGESFQILDSNYIVLKRYNGSAASVVLNPFSSDIMFYSKEGYYSIDKDSNIIPVTKKRIRHCGKYDIWQDPSGAMSLVTLDQEKLCACCSEYIDKRFVMFDCGHSIVCETCLKITSKCPKCDKEILRYIALQ